MTDLKIFDAPETPALMSFQTALVNNAVAGRPQAVELPLGVFEQMLVLTEAEIKTLMFIARQILGYTGRVGAALTYSDIADGVYGADGRLMDAGTGLCDKSIARAVKLLGEKGYLTVTPTREKRNRRTTSETSAGMVVVYSLGYRMRPVRPWAQQKPVVNHTDLRAPNQRRSLRAELDALAETA